MIVIFLDRDGVINEYPGQAKYVTSLKELKLIEGSVEAIKLFKEKNFKIFVVSNQAGVAKGLYSEQDLDAMTNEIMRAIHLKGADLDGIYYCLHKNEDDCDCRKPKPGLLLKALKDLGEKPDRCFFIGDSFRDMKAAKSIGCHPILVLSGKETLEERENWEFQPDHVFKNLLEAAQYICANYE